MIESYVVQFVCFDTSLSRAAFLSRWEPFASSFLARGIERVVLGEGEGEAGRGFGFVSRNVWPASRFHAAFMGRLPADAGAGPVTAIQAGAFRVVAAEGVNLLETAPVNVVKHLVFVRADASSRGALVPAISELAKRHDRKFGWAVYVADAATQGGRFDAALEIYGDAAWADRDHAALVESPLASVRPEELRIETLREVLALPHV